MLHPPLSKTSKLVLLMSIGAVPLLNANAQDQIEEVVIVGSQIKGASIAGALPVTVVGSDDIVATGAVSGDELLRSIPQIGAVGFNESRTTGVNAARGDVNSINLRGLGTGNTLVLLNGRRMVLHPGTQTENFTPVVTTNSNTLPVAGLERVEVLRDGAAALYGTDAVAGVINYKLKDDYEGSEINIRYGSSLGTDLDELIVSGATGLSFNDDKTRLNLMGTYYDKTGFDASERSYSASSDLRGFFADDPLFAGDTSLDNRSSIHGWGEFIYSGVGRQHLRPINLVTDSGGNLDIGDCSYQVNENLCLDPGGGDRILRGDRNVTRQLSPDSERINLFAFLNHEFDSGTEFYSELGYYKAEVNRTREAAGILSNSRFTVPASYYWNPLGPVTFADGRVNPNRIAPANDPDVPAAGLPFTLRTFVPYDVGPRMVTVDDDSLRFVVGLRGSWNDWDWDTGIVYSEAETLDSTDNRVSQTLFQQSLLLDNENAYNLFSGLDVNDTTAPFDPTPNPQAVLDTFRINVQRQSKTELALIDFKFSNPAIWSLPAGDVGVALGVEVREEKFLENRDDRSDGTVQFTDLVTGELLNVSDIMGSSASPDAHGSRTVTSLYSEFLIPLVRDVPGIQSLDMQLAARFEDFSDVGNVTRPKVAISYYPVSWLQFRGAYSEGFRAPNLLQLNQSETSVVNTRNDPVTGETVQLQEIRRGNRELEPEDSENLTFGVVLTPTNNLTITADYWRIEQDGVVGLLGSSNGLALDALLRSQGSSNPNLIRATTADGSIGEPVLFNDIFLNLDLREIEGVDVGIQYSIDNSLGAFDLKLNTAYLSKFDQTPSPELQQLIDAGLAANNAGSLIKENGRPRSRSTASLVWSKNSWGAGLFIKHVGEVVDTSTRADRDTANPDEPLPVGDFTTVSTNISYQFGEQGGVFENSRVRLGIRNIFDEDPPVTDEQLGYFGSLHSNRGRYAYLELNKKF